MFNDIFKSFKDISKSFKDIFRFKDIVNSIKLF